MDTSGTRIALGTIFFLSCLLHYLSTADVIYRPVDLSSITCGSSTNFSTLDGRNWTADIKFLFESHDSVAASAFSPSTQQGPYTTARLSHSQFTYSFPVNTAGPKFLCLFFYSTSYHQNFGRSRAFFSVKAGPHTLLQDFNASLNADADDDLEDILFRESGINLQDGQKQLNIRFIPSTADSYAFINGIEIVSMPLYLYYTNPNEYTGFPPLVGTTTQYQYRIENNLALETMYRLTVAGKQILPSEDTGMLRTWHPDDTYMHSQGAPSVDFGNTVKLSFTKTPNYTAPDQVYRTLRNMGPDASINMKFNLTWLLPVHASTSNCFYLQFPKKEFTPIKFLYIIFCCHSFIRELIYTVSIVNTTAYWNSVRRR